MRQSGRVQEGPGEEKEIEIKRREIREKVEKFAVEQI